jgi:sialidase-1
MHSSLKMIFCAPSKMIMNAAFPLLLLMFIQPCLNTSNAQSVSAKDLRVDSWHGFEREHFAFKERAAWIVKPKVALNGNPWVWRAHFPGWHTDVDSILLSRGFHIVYINTNDMFGSPAAMQIWDAFYDQMVGQRGLAQHVALEGVSRGGLYIYNWAKRNPLHVSCIYAEAPVCDFKSWPGGKGVGKGSPSDWKGVLTNYALSESEALAYKNNPIDNLEGLAAAKVPILHAVGLNDLIVPNEENTFLLVNNYIRLGGIATVYPMTKGDQNLEGHHFAIENPARIADFIFNNSYPVKKSINPSVFHQARTDLRNSYIKFSTDKVGRVAFMGGSITEGSGWREKVCSYLLERFPDTKFEFINAGISSTGSTPGAFRLQQDVLSKGMIDLFFEEAAVNDFTNNFNSIAQIRGMEGIMMHALKSNPNMDIVMMHFVDPEKITDYNNSIVPEVIQNHERVAEQHQVNSINLAKEVSDRIAAGEFTWKDDFQDLHPSLFGHEVYARSIKWFLDKSYDAVESEKAIKPHRLNKPIDRFSYSSGNYFPIQQAVLRNGWSLDANWAPTDGAGTRTQYVNIPALIATEPGAEMSLKFSGTAIGICIASGPDAGMIAYSIDGKPFKKLDLLTPWSGGLHLPWYLILEAELKPKDHRMVIRISSDSNTNSKGNACRIFHFLVNN